MKKNTNKGFMLVETLVVTTFVAGILVFLFIQFTNLSRNYSDSYKYNTVQGLYALKNIKNYIENDSAYSYIEQMLDTEYYINLEDCDMFSNTNYCEKLFEVENIEKIYVTSNYFDKEIFFNFDEGFKTFINKINSKGEEKYRLLVEFTDSTYATIRFGD